MKVGFLTLGCKVNQLETEALRHKFLEEGFSPGNFNEPCDVYVINTCSVTAVSDKKCRQAIRRAKKNNPAAVVAVTGCYSQLHPDVVLAMDEVDVVGGTKDKLRLVDDVKAFLHGGAKRRHVIDSLAPRPFELLTSSDHSARTRASVKIQDGCENFCSYCVIPFARGPISWMPFDAVLDEVVRLRDLGYHEIVLTGIHIASYGKGSDKTLLDLLRAANALPGDFRLRLGSLNPQLFTPEFSREIAGFEKLCPHFHISLQSGCDSVLKRMNRKYTAAQYEKALSVIREAMPDAAITTDVIVGFPGETEAEFSESLAFVERCGFLHVHIFPYSVRPGTAAARMEGQLSQATKEERAKRMDVVALRSKQAFLSRFQGRTMEVLFETKNQQGYFEGYTKNYIPVQVRSEENLHNRLFPVVLTKQNKTGFYGEYQIEGVSVDE